MIFYYIPVSYILLYNKWSQKVEAQNNNKHFLTHLVLVGQEFQSIPAGWFRLRVSGACSQLKVWLGLKDPFPRWHAHIICWQEASVSSHTSLSIGLLEHPQNMAASFPQSQWSKREQDARHNVFYNLALEVTLFHFCNILWLHRSALLIVEGNHPTNNWPTCKPFTRVWIIGSKDHWGPFWRLAMTVPFQSSLSSTISLFYCTHCPL